MTPLSKWNPYNIQHRGLAGSENGRQVLIGPKGQRNGGPHPNWAYNGTNHKKFYHTPVSFFLDQLDISPGDTVKNNIHVLDENDSVRAVRPSGFWIHLPEIPGVGVLRQRYPIMPLHEEGSSVWKELDALKDIVLNPNKYQQMMYEDRKCSNQCPTTTKSPVTKEPQEAPEKILLPVLSKLNVTAMFVTQESSPAWGRHEHHFTLSVDQVQELEKGNLAQVITEEANGHSHDLTLYKIGNKYMMGHCDCQISCFDGHGRRVFFIK